MLRWLSFGLVLLMSLWVAGCTSTGSGSPCQRNSDCNEGYKCLDGLCGNGKAGSPCSSSTHCLQGFLCIRKSCTSDPNPPKEPSESNTELHDAGEPSEPDSDAGDGGTDDEPREGDEPVIEPPPDTQGKKLCRVQEDCPEKTVCLVDSTRLRALCEPAPVSCKRSSDCKGMQGSSCQRITLRTGKMELYCTHSYDTGTPPKKPGERCTKNEECSSRICLQHSRTCGDFCVEDKDCPNDYYCGTYHQFQKGEVGGCYPRCTNNSECPDGYICNTRRECQVQKPKQIGSPCRSLKDCPSGGNCVSFWSGGYCLQGCRWTSRVCNKDKPCPAGESCRQSSNSPLSFCVPDCPGGSLCGAFRGGDAFCLRKCQTDQDCRQKYYCALLGDQKNRACLPRGVSKLGEQCQQNGDCESGLCSEFGNGRYCTQPCTTSCPVGFLCSQSGDQQRCEKSCLQDSDCRDGYQCLSRRCQIPPNTADRPIGSACSRDSHCLSGTCLRDNGLFAWGYCSLDCNKASCPEGSLCVELTEGKVCLRTCSPGKGCSRRENFCFALPLQEAQSGKPLACSDKQPCPTSPMSSQCLTSPTGRFCSVGLCLGRGQRIDGELCQQDFDCHSGLCYRKQPPVLTSISCTSDTQCQAPTPYCDASRKQCVQCRTNRDCRLGDCINNQCSLGGYCSQPCATGQNCAKGTHCAPLKDPQNQSLGQWCLLECRSSLQCQRDFSCLKTSSKAVCRLP